VLRNVETTLYEEEQKGNEYSVNKA
jgi:hypothetical protein